MSRQTFWTITLLLLRLKKHKSGKICHYIMRRLQVSSLNVPLNLSNKGVSCLFSRMKDSFSHVLDIAVAKWGENTDLDFGSFCLSKSFQKHHLRYKDAYLKNIQFRTLQHRFYTNKKLFKMGIKQSDLCSFCGISVDSLEHMLIQCDISRDLWNSVQNWIVELGMER